MHRPLAIASFCKKKNLFITFLELVDYAGEVIGEGLDEALSHVHISSPNSVGHNIVFIL
jgi:hypothetical protein